jgi:hypothetical protein
MMTVDKLFDLLPDGFLLVESDVLIKADIRQMWREEYSFTAYVQKQQRGNKFGMGRILPMLCYLNVPKFKAEGVRYFDPSRAWMLYPDENDRRNWYDTGASLLEDVLSHRPRLKGLHVDIRPMVEHLGGASYKTLKGQAEWLNKHADLWQGERLGKPKATRRTNKKINSYGQNFANLSASSSAKQHPVSHRAPCLPTSRKTTVVLTRNASSMPARRRWPAR